MKLTFPLALGLLFIGLKLGGIIDWSWWWVLAPFWGGIAFALFVITFIVFLASIIAWFDK